MDPVLVGVDAGTTNIKSAAFTLDGREVTRASRNNELQTPRTGWVEQDMESTWANTAATIRETVDALDGRPVLAVGVTGQGDGCWLIDEGGDPLRNAILWSDGRAADYLQDWRAEGIAAQVREITGCDLFPGAALPILRWLWDNEPKSVESAETILFCKDWIKYCLTGERTIDYSDASLPFLDVDNMSYSSTVPELVEVPGLLDVLPRLTPATEVIGTLTDTAAARIGLPKDTPVISGVTDIAASAFGSGAVEPGDSSSVVGTTSLNQTLRIDPPSELSGSGFTLALFEDLFCRSMASMAGTPNLDWALSELTPGWTFDRAARAAEEVSPTADGLLYHPYLSPSGERSPFLHPHARGQFIGLSPNRTKEHMIRAVYEGVALAMRDCYQHINVEASRITMSGGGAQSSFWCQLFADCIDAEIMVPSGAEFGARGVAMLAGVGIGEFEDIASAIHGTTSYERTYEPRDDFVPVYDEWYDVYRATYEAMFDVWDQRNRTLNRIQEQMA